MGTRTQSWNHAIDLSGFDEEFARAETRLPAEEAALEEVPDGIYDTRVEDVTLNRTASTGNPMVIWRLRIHGSDFDGRTLTKVRVITQKTLSFVKEDLDRLDLHLERLSDLNQRMEEMVDREIRVFKRTNPERKWAEVYFMRARKGPQTETSTEEAWRTGTDDDLPF
jgi:hypothetical protein